MSDSLNDKWICQRCLTLVGERDLGPRTDDGPGHDVGDDEPRYCGPCVPLDKEELFTLLDELSERRAAAKP